MDFKEFIVSENIDQLLKKANKFPQKEYKDLLTGKTDVIYTQWMANKEGQPPQEFGNQQIIFKLTPETFAKYIKPAHKIKQTHPALAKAPSYERLKEFLDTKLPAKDYFTTIIKIGGRDRWETLEGFHLATDKEYNEAIPSLKGYLPVSKYNIYVKDLESNEAKTWGSTADSDIYALSRKIK